MSVSVCLLLCSAVALSWRPCQGQGLNFKKAQDTIDALNKYPNFRKEVMGAMAMLEDLWTVDLPQLLKNQSDVIVSNECINSTVSASLFQYNITVQKIEYLQDATGKLGAGIFSGNWNVDAAFDECFVSNYTGFCSGEVNLVPYGSFSWTVGLCVPRRCKSSDVAAVMNFTKVFQVGEHALLCTDYRFPAYSAGSIVMITVCALLALLVAVGTVLDKILEYLYIYKKNSSTAKELTVIGSGESQKSPLLTAEVDEGKSICKVKWHEFITAFSLYKTLPTLLTTKQAPNVITSMNGIRVISLFWVITLHTYISTEHIDNAVDYLEINRRFYFQVVGQAIFAVDSLFALNGTLVAYLTLHQMQKRGRFPFLHYYIHRYLSLTPTYAFVLFSAWFLTNHIATGPSLSLSNPYAAQCSKYWWSNLLYINNLYPWKNEEECMYWSWYLANDMQFFVIAPVILIPLYYMFPVGLLIASALLACSFTITATLVGVFHFQGIDLITRGYTNVTVNQLDLLYIKPWSRIPPYLVGIVLGFMFYKEIRLPFSWKKNATIYLAVWVASGVLLISIWCGVYFTWNGHTPSVAENIIYLTFRRFAWGLGVALLVFACHNGYGGPINTFLSMDVWTPLSRMTFCVYLVHPIVITILHDQFQRSFHFTATTLATFTVAFIVFSFAVSVVLCVFVEFPLGRVEMLLFKLVGIGGRSSQVDGGEELIEEQGCCWCAHIQCSKH